MLRHHAERGSLYGWRPQTRGSGEVTDLSQKRERNKQEQGACPDVSRLLPASRKRQKGRKTGKACEGDNLPRTPMFLSSGFACRQPQGVRRAMLRHRAERGSLYGWRPQARGSGEAADLSQKRERNRQEQGACPDVSRLLPASRKRQKRHAGEIISPAPPCFCRQASPADSPGVTESHVPSSCGARFFVWRAASGPQERAGKARCRFERERGASVSGAELKDDAAFSFGSAEGPAKALRSVLPHRGARSVWGCPVGPTHGGRRLSCLRRTVVLMERMSGDFLREYNRLSWRCLGEATPTSGVVMCGARQASAVMRLEGRNTTVCRGELWRGG